MSAELFCPKCAAAMERRGSELTCVPGEMGLSRVLEGQLLARFGEHVRADAPPPLPGSAAWFCPACRTALSADMICATCGGGLRDLLFSLVDLHPHRKLT